MSSRPEILSTVSPIRLVNYKVYLVSKVIQGVLQLDERALTKLKQNYLSKHFGLPKTHLMNQPGLFRSTSSFRNPEDFFEA